jgi:hypothetical protein
VDEYRFFRKFANEKSGGGGNGRSLLAGLAKPFKKLAAWRTGGGSVGGGNNEGRPRASTTTPSVAPTSNTRLRGKRRRSASRGEDSSERQHADFTLSPLASTPPLPFALWASSVAGPNKTLNTSSTATMAEMVAGDGGAFPARLTNSLALGSGSIATVCQICEVEAVAWRCLNCQNNQLFCNGCYQQAHRHARKVGHTKSAVGAASIADGGDGGDDSSGAWAGLSTNINPDVDFFAPPSTYSDARLLPARDADVNLDAVLASGSPSRRASATSGKTTVSFDYFAASSARSNAGPRGCGDGGDSCGAGGDGPMLFEGTAWDCRGDSAGTFVRRSHSGE